MQKSKEQIKLIEKLQEKITELSYKDLKSVYLLFRRLDFYLDVLRPWFGRY